MIRRDRLSLLAIAVCLGLSILAMGGAPRWAQAAVAAAAAAALATQVTSRRTFQRWPPLVVMVAVATAWTVIQCIPLPDRLLELLTPVLHGLREDGATTAGVDTGTTLTMDVPATLRSLAFLLTVGGIAVVSLRVAASERGRYALSAVIAGFCGLAALIAGAHKLFGITSLYGLYLPRQASPPILGPLLNSNHLGCLMAIGTVTSVGLLLYPKQATRKRALWFAVGGCCLAVTLATISRGAVIALAAGMVVTGATLIAQRLSPAHGESARSRRARFFSATLPVGIVVTCILVGSVYIGAGSAVEQLQSTSLAEIHDPTSKFAAWRSSVLLIEDSPWIGVGRGAFESTFTRVHAPSAFVTFSHVENEALQAAVEWGIPLTIILGAFGGWILLLAVRRWNDGPLAASALGGVMVVAFQSNFDFGAELLGIAVPVTMLIASLTYVPLRDRDQQRPFLLRAARSLHIASLLGGMCLLILPRTRGLEDDHLALRDVPSREQIETSIANHPLDYLGYALLAQRALRSSDPKGVKLLNHALRLHPTHPALHGIAARLLVRAKLPGQAEIEYAAMIRGMRDPELAILEVVSALQPTEAANAIPGELDIDTTIRTLERAHRFDIALLWLQQVWKEHDDIHTTEVLYSVAMEANDLAAAETAARRRCVLVPTTRCRLALALVLARAKKYRDLVQELADVADWHGHRDDQTAAWLMLCDAQAALGMTSDARFCLRRLEGSGLTAPNDADLRRRFDVLDQPASLRESPRSAH